MRAHHCNFTTLLAGRTFFAFIELFVVNNTISIYYVLIPSPSIRGQHCNYATDSLVETMQRVHITRSDGTISVPP